MAGTLRKADHHGQCVCSEQSFDVAGRCVPASTLLPAAILPALVLVALCTVAYVRHAARSSDIRTIASAELTYSDPKEVSPARTPMLSQHPRDRGLCDDARVGRGGGSMQAVLDATLPAVESSWIVGSIHRSHSRESLDRSNDPTSLEWGGADAALDQEERVPPFD